MPTSGSVSKLQIVSEKSGTLPSKIANPIADLLKHALLMEHGGLMIDVNLMMMLRPVDELM